MFGYLVTASAGVDIPNADGTIGSGNGTSTHYAAGEYVPLSKLLPDQYRWYVQQGLISESVGNVTVSKASPTMSLLASSGGPSAILSAAPTNHAAIILQTNEQSRWIIRTDATTESGSNAGSNLDIVRRTDAGALLGTPLSINRATGLTTLESLSVTGAMTTPTPVASTNTTQVATTAYVKTAISNMFKAAEVANTALSWNSLTTPGPDSFLWHGTSNANGPGNSYYYYVVVFEYNGTNLTQVAYQYSTGGNIAIRSRYSGTWGSWVVLS